MKATIYHNSHCSKSNAAMHLLLENGVETSVIHYLETPLSVDELHVLLLQLGIAAKMLVRFGEPVAKTLGIAVDDIRTTDEWIRLMIEHPILIERPVVVIDNKAVIGRPPEVVLDLIKNG